MEDVESGIRKMSSSKAPGPGMVHCFWFGKLTFLYERITGHLQECLNSGTVPEWLNISRTVLIMKDRRKGKDCKQLSTYRLPSTHVEASDWHICGKNAQPSSTGLTTSRGAERMQERFKGNKRPTPD